MKMAKIWKYGIIAKRFFYSIVALIVMLPERAIIDLGHVDGCPCAQLCIALCVKPSPYIYHIISYHIISYHIYISTLSGFGFNCLQFAQPREKHCQCCQRCKWHLAKLGRSRRVNSSVIKVGSEFGVIRFSMFTATLCTLTSGNSLGQRESFGCLHSPVAIKSSQECVAQTCSDMLSGPKPGTRDKKYNQF